MAESRNCRIARHRSAVGVSQASRRSVAEKRAEIKSVSLTPMHWIVIFSPVILLLIVKVFGRAPRDATQMVPVAKWVSSLFIYGLIITTIFMALGLGVKTVEHYPDSSIVYYNNQEGAYATISCVDEGISTFIYIDGISARLIPLSQARARAKLSPSSVGPDPGCRQANGFVLRQSNLTVEIINSIAAWVRPPAVETFHGYDCTKDCSGHRAGYLWAAKKRFSNPFDCTQEVRTNSVSFMQGCQAYVDEVVRGRP